MPDPMLPPPALLYLMVIEGPWTGTLIPMKTTPFLIGRGPDCHLRPTSTRVEDRHCSILAQDGRLFIRASNRTTGTFLNDRQIFGKVELLDQDRLRIGPLQFGVNIPIAQSSEAAAHLIDNQVVEAAGKRSETR